MAARSAIAVELYRDKSGEHRWRVRHSNGNVLADCAEGYKNKGYARRAAIKFVALVKRTTYEKMLPE